MTLKSNWYLCLQNKWEELHAKSKNCHNAMRHIFKWRWFFSIMIKGFVLCQHSTSYVMWSSKMSRELTNIDLEIEPNKGNKSFCFLLFWESFNCFNFGTTGPIQVRFSAKCIPPNEDFNQIENWKCHMFNFRLIPLDRSPRLVVQCDHVDCFKGKIYVTCAGELGNK